MRQLKFKVYFIANGHGLRKDAELLREMLVALGYSCEIEESPGEADSSYYGKKAFYLFAKKINLLHFYKKIINRLLFSSEKTYSFHLEDIFFPALFRREHHVLIPNQEWFRSGNFELMQYISHVWCKTRLAESIFGQFHHKTSYIGFYSGINPDLRDGEKYRDYFYTRVGSGRFRGAQILVDVWRKNPVWPNLKMVISPHLRPIHPPANVEFIDPFVDADESYQLASSSLFHIYMTETEGFGHSIVEAMGYGALVIVTDAPPMNEITNSRSVLGVRAEYAGQKMLSPRFRALPHSIEESVEKVLAMSDNEKNEITQNARARFCELERQFTTNLALAIERLR